MPRAQVTGKANLPDGVSPPLPGPITGGERIYHHLAAAHWALGGGHSPMVRPHLKGNALPRVKKLVFANLHRVHSHICHV